MTNCLINRQLEAFLVRLSDIDKLIEKHWRGTGSRENDIAMLEEIKNSVYGLIKDIEKSIKELIKCSEQLITEKQENRHHPIIKILPEQAQNGISSQELKFKASAMINSASNPEKERDFRKICSEYESLIAPSDLELNEAYNNYITAYHQTTSLHLIKTYNDYRSNFFGSKIDNNCRNSLIAYNTELEIERETALDIPQILYESTCIAQLPNGELFCFGKESPVSGITLIIDKNYKFRVLPSGTPCYNSSAIYFNKNVYCFGGRYNVMFDAALSERFDFDKNRWIKLTPMQKADFCVSSMIFNGNILVAGYKNQNLLLYSIDMDSFSTIPYGFGEQRKKLLINADRLYLIECRGMVYESEVRNEYSWKPIAKSIIKSDNPGQIYCSYNKGGIYIGEFYVYDRSNYFRYYKFDLIRKVMVELKANEK